MLKTALARRDSALIRGIAENPARYDLTYALWQLVMGAKGTTGVYTEELEDFGTETEPGKKEQPQAAPEKKLENPEDANKDSEIENDEIADDTNTEIEDEKEPEESESQPEEGLPRPGMGLDMGSTFDEVRRK